MIIGATLAGLVALGMVASGLTAGLRSVGTSTAAPGPATVFLTTAPATVDGLPASADADLQPPLAQMKEGSDKGATMMGGSGGTLGQAYAVGRDRIAFVTWTTIRKPVAQKAVITGIRAAWTKDRATGAIELAEPDGATIVCATLPRPDGLQATMCSWVRSGSGIVQMVEIGGGGPTEIAGVLRGVVQGLSGTA